MSAKLCPRCGGLYQSLKSATCPQCFALLDTIDDTTAREIAAQKSKEEASEEFQQARQQDNEAWAEQSFKACVSIVGIALITVVVCIVLVVSASHRLRHQTAVSETAALDAESPDAIPAGPSGAAVPDELMPAICGAFVRQAPQSQTMLPGGTDSVLHAGYLLPSLPGKKGKSYVYDVFILRQTSMETHRDSFELGCAMAANVGGSKTRPIVEGETRHWHFAVIGDSDPGGDVRARNLLGQVMSSGSAPP